MAQKKTERKITTRKLKKNEWQEYISKSIHQEHIREERREKKRISEQRRRYKKYIPVPITIGIIASVIMYKEYGAFELVKTLLSWTIGITIVSTLLASARK